MRMRISHGSYQTVLAALLFYAVAGVPSISHAQVVSNIVANRTLPTPTVVGSPVAVPSGKRFDISGGTVGGGVNQFHSFDRFSVGTGDIANFGVANTIQNLISRVTGGVGSQIDGTLTSTISGTSTISSANLFLLNPAGILFGKNAQLNIGGSFHASTGDYVKLGTDGIFYADPAQASVLTSAPPSAFGFLTSNPAAIDVQTGTFSSGNFTRRLQVPVGKTLSFVGGSVNMGAPSGQPPAGFVFAPGGVVNIASVASPGEATLAGGINADGFAKLGEIHLTGGAVVDGKEINIRGGRLEITDATLFPGVSFQRLAGAPAPNGGQVNINVTDDVTITAISPAVAIPGIQTFAGSGSTSGVVVPGDVPGINIKAGSLSMSGPAAIQSSRFGPANPPTVAITANDIEVRNGASIGMTNSFGGDTFPTGGGTLTINGNNMTLASKGSSRFTGISATGTFHPAYGAGAARLFSPFFQFADSASVTINLTGNLTVQDNAQITTDSFAFGRSGAININAANMLFAGAGPNTTAVIAAQSERASDSGNVTLRATGNIDIQNGFRVSANTFGSGNGGAVDVTAGGPITLTGANSRILSGTLQVTDQELNPFAQRFIAFFTNNLHIPISDYASLRKALGIAPAPGDLMQVLAKLHAIKDSAGNPLVAITDFIPGDAGRISITTPLLTMNADTRIETSTGWDGNAGAVLANVGSLFLNDGAAIRSTSGIQRLTGEFSIGAGNAGSVTITTTDPNTTSISGRSPTTGGGSSISTTTIGTGNAGDIALNSAGTVQVSNGGQVTSSTSGTGAGGTVGVTASELLSISGEGSGLFSTASSRGNAGRITVSAPTLTIGGGGTISVATSGAGNAGNILLNVANFTQTGGATVDSSTTAQGTGGAITLTSTDPASSVSITGAGSGLLSTASSTGNAGEITVASANGVPAPTLTVSDGGAISVATSGVGRAGDIAVTASSVTLTGGARVDSSTTGAGRGGTVTVNAAGPATISSGAGLFSTATGSGAGGDLNIRAAELQLLDGAIISANSSGTDTALAGNVNIVAGSLFQMANSTITTQAAVADGGNISISTTGSLLQLTDSQITTSVQSGVGKGGNITIGSTLLPTEFILLDTSQVRADAFGGPGGNINVNADVYLTSDSLVSASSALSTPGTINIQAQVTNVTGSLTQLPTTPLEAAALLRASCAARLAGGKSSSLVLAGREGLPLDPSGLLPSPLVVEGPVAALSPSEEYPWLGNLLRVTQLSLDPNCSK